MNLSVKHKLFYTLLAVLLLSCTACKQDPIFYAISQEVKPRPPRVPGTPTAMVLFYRQYENPEGVTERVPVVYIASTTTLHWYTKPANADAVDPLDKSWDKQKGDQWWDTAKGKVSQPGGTGNITGLAATRDYLYAVYQKQLKRIKWDSEPDAQWEDVPLDPAVEALNITYDTIFSSNNRIFIGGRLPEKEKAIPCAILYVDNDEKIQLLRGDTHLLKGVAFNGTSHFLCVNNLYAASDGSIFKLDDSSFPASAPLDIENVYNTASQGKSNSIPVIGIISLEDDTAKINHTIIAMDRSGNMYTIHTHQWGEWEVTTPVTETTDGEETRTCALDPEHIETRAILAPGKDPGHTHQWGEWEVTTPATKTTDGEETRTCALDPAHIETRNIPSKDTDNTFTSTEKSIGRSTGALALWRDPQSPEWDPDDLTKKPLPKLLLAGYQGELILTTSTGYTNGYYEFDLVWKDGTLDTGADDFHDPGKTGINEITTVDNNERYVSTIGKYPINSFFQTPRDIDENMTLFASTVNEGLWSYRGREGLTQWNAEE